MAKLTGPFLAVDVVVLLWGWSYLSGVIRFLLIIAGVVALLYLLLRQVPRWSGDTRDTGGGWLYTPSGDGVDSGGGDGDAGDCDAGDAGDAGGDCGGDGGGGDGGE